MTRSRFIPLVAFFIALPAYAQAPQPDLSSPAAALTSAYSALRAGDIPTAKACITFQTPAQAELFDITYTQLYAPLKLMHAMEAKFGDAAKKPFANAALDKSLSNLIEKIKTTEFKIEGGGNTAAVADKKAAVNPSAESELTGITFRKEGAGAGSDGNGAAGGGWKIVASSFTDVSGDLPPTQLTFMRSLSNAVNAAVAATSARLAKGDFKTADDAYADYQARLQEATRAAAIAATQKP